VLSSRYSCELAQKLTILGKVKSIKFLYSSLTKKQRKFMHLNVEAAGPTTIVFRTFSLIWWNNNVHTYLICHFNVNPTADRQNGKTRKGKIKITKKESKMWCNWWEQRWPKNGFTRVINTFVVPADSTGQNVGQLTVSLWWALILN